MATDSVDHLGGDPVEAYRTSAAELRAAFARPGVPERVYPGPLGDATGADLAFAQEQTSTQARAGRFAEPRPVDPGAPAIDRLAAFLGRTVQPQR